MAEYRSTHRGLSVAMASLALGVLDVYKRQAGRRVRGFLGIEVLVRNHISVFSLSLIHI